jgi:fumarate reductase subunit D
MVVEVATVSTFTESQNHGVKVVEMELLLNQVNVLGMIVHTLQIGLQQVVHIMHLLLVHLQLTMVLINGM